MAESQEIRGSDRVSERPAPEPRGESAAHQEVTQERQSATGTGVKQQEQIKTDTNRLETRGQLPICSMPADGSNESGTPDSPKKTAKQSEADKMLRGFSVAPDPSADASADVRAKAADGPAQPFTLSASEYRDMLKAGPQPGIERICSTVPQSPAVSKKEIQNTCGIDLKAKLPEAQKGVVQVYGEGGRVGTGFLACEKNNCQIVTDEHVVGNGKQVMIVKDGKGTPGTVTARDSENDLATVSIDPKRLPGLKPLPLGSGMKLTEGDPVFAVGHGKQMPEQSIVPGQVTNPSVGVRTRDGSLFPDQVDSDMKAVPGHSGSPVLDKEGRVVAVVGSGGRTGTSGPKVERVKDLLKKAAP